MSFKMNYIWFYRGTIPEGFITGLNRSVDHANIRLVAHLYKGTFSDPGLPMCKRGYTDKYGGYSIFRNNVGRKGVCKVCLRRALDGKDGVEFKEEIKNG